MKLIKPWRLIETKDVSISEWFPVEERVYQKSDGQLIDDFTVLTVPNVSLVIPITIDNKIVMVRQFKPGADQITLEFPGGRLKANESFLQGAKTELLEETGMAAEELIELGETTTFPTKSSEKVMNYIGLHTRVVAEQNLDETEEIEVVYLTKTEIEQAIASGEINTAPSITCWYLAKVKQAELLYTL